MERERIPVDADRDRARPEERIEEPVEYQRKVLARKINAAPERSLQGRPVRHEPVEILPQHERAVLARPQLVN